MRFGAVGMLLVNGFSRVDEPRHAAYNPADAKRKRGVIVEKMFMLLRCLCCCVHFCTLVYVEKGFAIERCTKSDALKKYFSR